MERLKTLLSKIMDARGNAPGAAMRYIRWYAGILAGHIVLYVLMIIADWCALGHPSFQAALDLLDRLISASTLAAVAFVARWLVDKDGDGVPDVMEKGDEHDGKTK